MNSKNHTRKINNNILLLTILIGFCILAIIEIAYGQTRIRMERERLALEEENHQAVQELKEEWNSLQGQPDVGTESLEEVGSEQNSGAESEKTLINTGEDSSDFATGQDTQSGNSVEDNREYAMQIVVLGDSIMAAKREENQDVPIMIGESCNAKVYNLAIGGTTAALLPDEQYNFSEWSSNGLLGVVNAIFGNIDPDILGQPEVAKNIRECDFSKTDYFVIEYGINDFQSRKIPQSRYLENGEELENYDSVHTYAGALEAAVTMLQTSFPNAKIMLISPHYCQFFEGTTFIGDAYSLNYGCGTLVDYFRCTGYVAEQHKADGTIFFNAMEESGIDAYSAKEYLEDGTHLSNLGRRVYADEVARRINADFYRAE